MGNTQRIAFHTLGCKLNFSETASISRSFGGERFREVGFMDVADLYVIHSCTVTANAEKRCRELIRRAHRTNPDAHIAVIGCYAQLEADELAAIPGVSIVLGNTSKYELYDHAQRLFTDEAYTHGKDTDDAYGGEGASAFPGRDETTTSSERKSTTAFPEKESTTPFLNKENPRLPIPMTGTDLTAAGTAGTKASSAREGRPADSGEKQSDPPMEAGSDRPTHFVPTWSSEGRTRSFFKIQDGCDYHCAYCTIPLARGRSRSNTIEATLEAARHISGSEIREMVLTGVNIGDFGKPHKESFLELLGELARLEDLPRIRLSSIEPDLLHDDIIELVAREGRLMPHFHIPLQSGSDTILRAMGRRYDTALFASRVNTIRKLIPHACIAADVIVGYPGETGELFQETLNLLEALDISCLHVFTYSERKNTRAAGAAQAVNHAAKKERSQRMQQLSHQKKTVFIQNNRGRCENILWEKQAQQGYMYGFTENYLRAKTPYDPERVNTIEAHTLNSTDTKGVYLI